MRDILNEKIKVPMETLLKTAEFLRKFEKEPTSSNRLNSVACRTIGSSKGEEQLVENDLKDERRDGERQANIADTRITREQTTENREMYCTSSEFRVSNDFSGSVEDESGENSESTGGIFSEVPSSSHDIPILREIHGPAKNSNRLADIIASLKRSLYSPPKKVLDNSYDAAKKDHSSNDPSNGNKEPTTTNKIKNVKESSERYANSELNKIEIRHDKTSSNKFRTRSAQALMVDRIENRTTTSCGLQESNCVIPEKDERSTNTDCVTVSTFEPSLAQQEVVASSSKSNSETKISITYESKTALPTRPPSESPSIKSSAIETIEELSRRVAKLRTELENLKPESNEVSPSLSKRLQVKLNTNENQSTSRFPRNVNDDADDHKLGLSDVSDAESGELKFDRKEKDAEANEQVNKLVSRQIPSSSKLAKSGIRNEIFNPNFDLRTFIKTKRRHKSKKSAHKSKHKTKRQRIVFDLEYCEKGEKNFARESSTKQTVLSKTHSPIRFIPSKRTVWIDMENYPKFATTESSSNIETLDVRIPSMTCNSQPNQVNRKRSCSMSSLSLSLSSDPDNLDSLDSSYLTLRKKLKRLKKQIHSKQSKCYVKKWSDSLQISPLRSPNRESRTPKRPPPFTDQFLPSSRGQYQSPTKRSQSPRQCHQSSKRKPCSRKRLYGSAQNYYAPTEGCLSTKRNSRSPKRHLQVSGKFSPKIARSQSPQNHHVSPKRKFCSSRRKSTSPQQAPKQQQRFQSPKRKSHSPERTFVSFHKSSLQSRRLCSPIKGFVSKRNLLLPKCRQLLSGKSSLSPKRQWQSSKKRSLSPRQPHRSPKQKSRSPRRMSALFQRSPGRKSRSPKWGNSGKFLPSPKRQRRTSRSPKPSSAFPNRIHSTRRSPLAVKRRIRSPKRCSYSPKRRSWSRTRHSRSPEHAQRCRRRSTSPSRSIRRSPLTRQRRSRSLRRRSYSPRRQSWSPKRHRKSNSSRRSHERGLSTRRSFSRSFSRSPLHRFLQSSRRDSCSPKRRCNSRSRRSRSLVRQDRSLRHKSRSPISKSPCSRTSSKSSRRSWSPATPSKCSTSESPEKVSTVQATGTNTMLLRISSPPVIRKTFVENDRPASESPIKLDDTKRKKKSTELKDMRNTEQVNEKVSLDETIVSIIPTEPVAVLIERSVNQLQEIREALEHDLGISLNEVITTAEAMGFLKNEQAEKLPNPFSKVSDGHFQRASNVSRERRLEVSSTSEPLKLGKNDVISEPAEHPIVSIQQHSTAQGTLRRIRENSEQNLIALLKDVIATAESKGFLIKKDIVSKQAEKVEKKTELSERKNINKGRDDRELLHKRIEKVMEVEKGAPTKSIDTKASTRVLANMDLEKPASGKKPDKGISKSIGAKKSVTVEARAKREEPTPKLLKQIQTPKNKIPKNTDIEMHSNCVNRKECVICKGIYDDIVDHYVNMHRDNEIFIARLERSRFNFAKANPNLVFREYTVGYVGKCIFCSKELRESVMRYLEHFASHTGEFPYKCSRCGWRFAARWDIVQHLYLTRCAPTGDIECDFPSNTNDLFIQAYVCSMCNYTQMYKDNLFKHIRTQHDKSEITLLDWSNITLFKVANSRQIRQLEDSRKIAESIEQIKRDTVQDPIFKPDAESNKEIKCAVEVSQDVITIDDSGEEEEFNVKPKALATPVAEFNEEIKPIAETCKSNNPVPESSKSKPVTASRKDVKHATELTESREEILSVIESNKDTKSMAEPESSEEIKSAVETREEITSVAESSEEIKLAESRKEVPPVTETSDANGLIAEQYKDGKTVAELTESIKLVSDPHEKHISAAELHEEIKRVSESSKLDEQLVDTTVLVPLEAIPNKQCSNQVPKNTNIEMHSNYVDQKKCVVCEGVYDDIVDHYVNIHRDNENFIARLEPSRFNFLKANPNLVYRRYTAEYVGRCVFCSKELCGSAMRYLEHFAGHTGEFPYQCFGCGLRFAARRNIVRHLDISGCAPMNKIECDFPSNISNLLIQSYVCNMCNYTQMHRDNLFKHVKTQHDKSEVTLSDWSIIILFKVADSRQKRQLIADARRVAESIEQIKYDTKQDEIFESAAESDKGIKCVAEVCQEIITIDDSSEEEEFNAESSALVTPMAELKEGIKPVAEICKDNNPFAELNEEIKMIPESSEEVPSAAESNKEMEHREVVTHIVESNEKRKSFAKSSEETKLAESHEEVPTFTESSERTELTAKQYKEDKTVTKLNEGIKVIAESHEVIKTVIKSENVKDDFLEAFDELWEEIEEDLRKQES